MEKSYERRKNGIGTGNMSIDEGLTSIIYGSAVNVLLFYSIRSVTYLSFLALVMILFFFLDWSTRIRVPLNFPLTDRTNRNFSSIQFMKTSTEIVGIFFLLISCVLFLSKNDSSFTVSSQNFLRLSFAGYLFMSFLWNMVSLLIMKDITWRELILSGIKGDVYDLKGAKIYTKRFLNNFTTFVLKIKEENDGPVLQKIPIALKFIHRIGKESIGRSIAQFLAHHIAWVNLIVAIYIVLTFFLKDLSFPFQIILINTHLQRFLLLLSIFIVPNIFMFIFLLHNTKRWDDVAHKKSHQLVGTPKQKPVSEENSNSDEIIETITPDEVKRPDRCRFWRVLGGLSSIIFLLFFYSNLSIDLLIYVMFFEQIFVTLTILSSTPKTPPSEEPESSSITV